MNGHNVIRFDDGTKLKTCTKYTYLGHHIAQSLNVRQEVGQRMQQTMKTWFKLEPVWKTAHCDHPKQTRQCVKNPSRYPNHVKEEMDAFHLRGLLWSMLGLRTTFLYRRHVN